MSLLLSSVASSVIIAVDGGGGGGGGEYLTALPDTYTSVSNVILNSGSNRTRVFAYGPVLTGKRYWEFTRIAGNASDSFVGVVGASVAAAKFNLNTAGTGLHDADAFGWTSTGFFYTDDVLSTGFSSWNGLATSEVVMLAYDADTGEFWEGVNGVWGSDPTSTSGRKDFSAWADLVGGVCVAVTCRQPSVSFELKTTVGSLSYTLPTGFSTLV
jgi:hypothetical protein